MTTDKEQKLVVGVKLKISDVLRYNMYVAYRSWFSRIILVIGIALAVWLGYRMTTSTVSIDLFLSQNIVMIVVAVFILIGTPSRVWRITATQMQSPIFSGTTHYEFAKESIFIRIQDMEDTVQWETYSRIVETGKDFRLFVDKVQAQIIPKHNMTEEQIVHFRALVKEANAAEFYQLKNNSKMPSGKKGI